METYWVICSWIKGNRRYYMPRPDMNHREAGIDFFVKDWLETCPHGPCEKFKTEADAIQRIKDGRKKEHWGGVFQVERIFVSR